MKLVYFVCFTCIAFAYGREVRGCSFHGNKHYVKDLDDPEALINDDIGEVYLIQHVNMCYKPLNGIWLSSRTLHADFINTLALSLLDYPMIGVDGYSPLPDVAAEDFSVVVEVDSCADPQTLRFATEFEVVACDDQSSIYYLVYGEPAVRSTILISWCLSILDWFLSQTVYIRTATVGWNYLSFAPFVYILFMGYMDTKPGGFFIFFTIKTCNWCVRTLGDHTQGSVGLWSKILRGSNSIYALIKIALHCIYAIIMYPVALVTISICALFIVSKMYFVFVSDRVMILKNCKTTQLSSVVEQFNGAYRTQYFLYFWFRVFGCFNLALTLLTLAGYFVSVALSVWSFFACLYVYSAIMKMLYTSWWVWRIVVPLAFNSLALVRWAKGHVAEKQT